MSKLDRIFWGVCLCLSAILVVLQSFGIIDQSFIAGTIIVFIWAGFVMISGIVRKKLPSFIIGACFLVLASLPLFGITDFPILGITCAFAVGATGIYWLMPSLFDSEQDHSSTSRSQKRDYARNGNQSNRRNSKRSRNPYKRIEEKYSKTTSKTSKGWYQLTNTFKKVEEYIDTDSLQGASIENKLGHAAVHFERLIIMHEDITILVNNSFGNTTLYIPSSWNVSVEPKCLFGKVHFRKKPRKQFGINVKIVAQSSFGKIFIEWIEK